MAQGPMSSILVMIWITVRIQESEVRNLHSLDYRKSYQRFFDEILWRAGVWPRDQLITFWCRSALLSGSGSPFRIVRIQEELAFGGGLCFFIILYSVVSLHLGTGCNGVQPEVGSMWECGSQAALQMGGGAHVWQG